MSYFLLQVRPSYHPSFFGADSRVRPNFAHSLHLRLTTFISAARSGCARLASHTWSQIWRVTATPEFFVGALFSIYLHDYYYDGDARPMNTAVKTVVVSGVNLKSSQIGVVSLTPSFSILCRAYPHNPHYESRLMPIAHCSVFENDLSALAGADRSETCCGVSVLEYAALLGKFDVVSFLLSRDGRAREDLVLMRAMQCPFRDVTPTLELLGDALWRMLPKMQPSLGDCCRMQPLEMVKWLLPVDNLESIEFLLLQCCYGKRDDVFDWLLSLGKPISSAHVDLAVALKVCCELGDTRRLEKLLGLGVPNLLIDDVSALHLAARQGKLDIARALLEAGTDPNLSSNQYVRTPLFFAVEEEDLEMVRLLLEHDADVNAVDCYGRTVLFYSVLDNEDPLPMVELLLAHEADATAADFSGVTVLHSHVAASTGGGPVTSALLKAGANPRAVDSFSNTPLHFGYTDRSRAAMHVLLVAGADPFAKNDDGLGAICRLSPATVRSYLPVVERHKRERVKTWPYPAPL